MSAKPKPVIFIVHGGWHVPESYKKFTDVLRSQGYEVHLPRLPSVNGARPPNAGLADDCRLVRSYVESLVQAGRTIVLFLHSYGGVVGCNALCGLSLEERTKQGLAGGISHMIIESGYLLPEGVSPMDKNVEFGTMHLVPYVMDVADDGTSLKRDPKASMFGPAPDETAVEESVATLVRWNGNVLYEAPEQAAWREIPITYISSTLDMTLPLDYQLNMMEGVEKAGRRIRKYELVTSHCPHVTETERIVEIVNEVVDGDESWYHVL
ncbi:alpha/beta-hydrolase [Xylaria sp. CBS 124048]|nr:alpha/beta-hydrolase [Xylaria sp. CBS 124048]